MSTTLRVGANSAGSAFGGFPGWNPTATYANQVSLGTVAPSMTGSQGLGVDTPIDPYMYANNFGGGSLDGSLFSPYSMMGGMGYGMGMGMYGAYDPAMAKMSPIERMQYFNQMSDTMEDYQINRQVVRADKQRNADLRINGNDNAIDTQVKTTKRLIEEGDQDEVADAYDRAVALVKKQYHGATDEQAKSILESNYNVAGAIQASPGGSEFWHGFKDIIGFGLFTDNKTKKDNLAYVTGAPVSHKDKNRRKAGEILGGVLLATAAIGIFALTKGRVGTWLKNRAAIKEEKAAAAALAAA